MEKFKSPKPTSHFTTKIKNIKIKAKDNETFHFSKSPNADKKPTNKNFIPIKSNKKNMTKKSIMNPSYSLSDLKSKINDKQTIPLTKKKNENIIKETKIFNIQNKAKGRSLEKVPSQNIQRNKNKTINNSNNNNNDLNKKKDKIKNVNEIGKKNIIINNKKNNSAGKSNNSNNKNKNNNNVKNDKNINKNNNNNNNKNEKGKQSQINENNNTKSKSKSNLNDYNNIDILENINIDQEKLNQNENQKNNYKNYNIINNNLDSSERISAPNIENIPFKKYNSVCVSINNNYNYNVSLKPSQTENINNLLNQNLIKQDNNNNNDNNKTHKDSKDNTNNKNNIKNKEKEKEMGWKEKLMKINNQKKNMNNLDYRKLNHTDSNFWKKKNEMNNSKKDDKNKIENINIKQKIKKLNSISADDNNILMSISNNSENLNEEKNNEPKKKNGILGFLRSFKVMLKPFNLRKKNKTRNNTDTNSNKSANFTKNNIKELLNKSDNNNVIDNKKKNEINTIKPAKTETNKNKKNIFEKKNINMNKKKEEDKNNNNKLSNDKQSDTTAIPSNQKNINICLSSTNIKNNNNPKENPNTNMPQILSYSQKNILKNDNEIYVKRRIESSYDIKKEYNINKSEENQKDNSLFNIFEIKNNKLCKKSLDNENNNNYLYNNFYKKNVPPPLNDINLNSTYVKKTKKTLYSPSISNKSEKINNNKYNLNDIDNLNNVKEIKKFSFKDINLSNPNYNNVNANYKSLNLERENIFLEKHKLIEEDIKDKYNSENIEENLNINAEKKIQEIKININYKKDKNNNNTISYDSRFPSKDQCNNNDQKFYNTMDDFLLTPKPKAEIETCIITFNKNKNKPAKVYENNLNTTPMNYAPNNNFNNNNYNLNNNNNNYNFNNINNNDNYNFHNNKFNKPQLNENFTNYSYSNIHDTDNINNNNNNNLRNVYLKPNNLNNNLNQSEKNIKRGINLSLSEMDMNNMNFEAPKPIKKMIYSNQKDKKNKFIDSQEFDNDNNSVNSEKSNESNESAKTSISQITNSIYSKPFKNLYKNNNKNTNNNFNNNVTQNIFNTDNNKYNTDLGINPSHKERIFNMTNPGYYKPNIDLSSEDIISNNYNNKGIYYKRKNNDNLYNTDLDINPNNKNHMPNQFQVIYTKKSKSSKNNNNILAINNVTPIPSYNFNLTNDNKVNNIKTIIRPKIIQKNSSLIHKIYGYYMRYPKIEEKNYYFSKDFVKTLKMPLKDICFCTKYCYKIIQKPKIKINYIDKKRIKKSHLPISQNCFFTKKNSIVIIPNEIIKKFINEEISIQFNDDYNLLYKLSDDIKIDHNDSEDLIENKDEKQINLDKELRESIRIEELEKDNNVNNLNININNEINNNSKKYSTPTHDLKENEDNEIPSPHFACISDNNLPKSAQNKIISIEIQLNNKNKYANKNDDISANKNLSSTYNNIKLNQNDTLYIKKKPNINNNKIILNQNNNNRVYNKIEDDKCKTYVKEHTRNINNININNFHTDDDNLYLNNYSSKSNKIICIDIDLSKEQKKIKEQKEKELLIESKEIKTYKRPTLAPLLDYQSKNLKNKIDTITINYNQDNINNNINTNLNQDKLKQEIILKLNIVSKNNILLIVDELLNLLTKKIIIDNINNKMNYNNIRLSFMDILTNENCFAEIIINKAICEINKIGIFANVCNELCARLRNEINFRGNSIEEDLTTLLAEDCKLKFEEIIIDNIYNKKLLGIILFICELINFRIISLDIGYFCFEKLCNKYNSFINDSGNTTKYYYLDIIVEFVIKYGKIIYIEKNMKYLERIQDFIDNELNHLLSNDIGLPDFLKIKIINLMKSKNNKWMIK